MGSCPESPSAKSSASSISAFVPSSRPPLPVMALRDKIVDKIRENRVTLIVGDTGCGKSSQVPQFLLEENMEPILCTQPRRFAVVAIARMVAKARNCDVGSEVGYHIGHSNVSDMSQIRSRIVFKTAGVLLEQMRDKGALALNYKVIILDEVHERSVESDLVLACVKQFMAKITDLRVVLMSATADISRYKDYFNDLGRGERVEVIAIPSTSQNIIFQRNVLYLEKVADLLGICSESLSERYCSGLSPSASADMKPEVHTLIHKLVLHIHENEPDIKKSILVFLPTYYSLEQQWILLKPLQSTFKVHILHRSIDTDQALLAMRICESHRKVILATNIAESSVTIPGVAYVIDSCRSLQVFWDANRKTDSSKLVWVSKSQADQRKGRTGRTCDGQIYRLITGNFYNNLRDHEYPAILRLSLRQHVLMICCAGSKAINDPKVLLHKVLDPPDSEIIEDALNLLVSVHALEKSLSHRGRYEPTFFGRLLDSLPLSFDASVLTLKFGDVGLLREGILISILMDVQPLPILHPFGHSLLFTKFVDNFFEGGNNNSLQTGKKETILMGNLCAFYFWQRVFKDKHRLHHLKHILKIDEPKTSHAIIPKLEDEWCLLHNLVQTSLRNVSEIYEDIINTMHRFRPDFLAANTFSSYFDPYTFKHKCLLQSDLPEEMEGLQLDEENMDSVRCVTAPYVAPNDFHVVTVSERLITLIREIRVQYTEETPCNPDGTAKDIGPAATDSALCRFFMAGSCNKGTQCGFSHSLQAKRPVCKYFLTFEGCRFGDKCFYSHDYGPTAASIISRTACLQEEGNASAYSFMQFLQVDGYVLIMNDKDLNFSTFLSCNFGDPTMIFVSTSDPYSPDIEASLPDVTMLWDVRHPRQLFIENRVHPIPWGEICCVLLFADIGSDDDSRVQQRMMQNFFELLAIRVLADTLFRLQVIVTMNNIRFTQLQVEKLARESFFYLTHSFLYDELTFGKFSDPSKITRPMQVSATFSYVFDMRPPIDLQFGDYTSDLRRGLYGGHEYGLVM